jgi:hypothetical protein
MNKITAFMKIDCHEEALVEKNVNLDGDPLARKHLRGRNDVKAGLTTCTETSNERKSTMDEIASRSLLT